MKLRASSVLLLLSFSLTPALRADESSQWMWHGTFPWVYSHAESSWWYMPLSESRSSASPSGWMWHGAFPWVYSYNESDWRYMKSTSSGGKFYLGSRLAESGVITMNPPHDGCCYMKVLRTVIARMIRTNGKIGRQTQDFMVDLKLLKSFVKLKTEVP
jgi:hypothetical protein